MASSSASAQSTAKFGLSNSDAEAIAAPAGAMNAAVPSSSSDGIAEVLSIASATRTSPSPTRAQAASPAQLPIMPEASGGAAVPNPVMNALPPTNLSQSPRRSSRQRLSTSQGARGEANKRSTGTRSDRSLSGGNPTQQGTPALANAVSPRSSSGGPSSTGQAQRSGVGYRTAKTRRSPSTASRRPGPYGTSGGSTGMAQTIEQSGDIVEGANFKTMLSTVDRRYFTIAGSWVAYRS